MDDHRFRTMLHWILKLVASLDISLFHFVVVPKCFFIARKGKNIFFQFPL